MSDHEATNGVEPASLKISISPEPTGDEEEALVAAITVYLVRQTSSQPASSPEPLASRWLMAGRKQALKGLAKSPQMGWGRGPAI